MAAIFESVHAGFAGPESVTAALPIDTVEHDPGKRSPGEIKSLFANVPPLASDDLVHPTIPRTETSESTAFSEVDSALSSKENERISGVSTSLTQQTEQAEIDKSPDEIQESAKSLPTELDSVVEREETFVPATIAPAESYSNETRSFTENGANILSTTQESEETTGSGSRYGRDKDNGKLVVRNNPSEARYVPGETLNAEVRSDGVQLQGPGTLQNRTSCDPRLQSSFPISKVSVGKSKIFKIQRSAYVSPDLPIKPAIDDIWTNHIQQRLEREILQTIRSSSTNDFSVVLQCMMAGATKSKLRPHIVVFCSTEALRKKLAKEIKSYTWIGKFDLSCLVAVYPVSSLSLDSGAIIGIGISVPGFLTVFALSLYMWWRRLRRRRRDLSALEARVSAAPEMSEAKPAPTSTTPFLRASSIPEISSTTPNMASASMTIQGTGASVYTAEIQPVVRDYSLSVKGNSGEVPVCGVPLRLALSAHLAPMCTLGGLLVVDNGIVGITTAHGINKRQQSSSQAHQCQSEGIELRDATPDAENTESPFIHFDESESKVSPEGEIGDSEQDEVIEPLPQLDHQKDLKESLREQRQPVAVTGILHRLSSPADWATVLFPGTGERNKTFMPVKNHSSIKKIAAESDLKPGPVKVPAGFTGPLEGLLSRCSVSIWQENNYL